MWAIGDVGSGVVAEVGGVGGRRVPEGGVAWAMAQKGQVGSYEVVVGERGIWFGGGGGFGGEGLAVELRRLVLLVEGYVRIFEYLAGSCV